MQTIVNAVSSFARRHTFACIFLSLLALFVLGSVGLECVKIDVRFFFMTGALTLFYPFGENVPVELLDKDENVVYTDCLIPGQTSLIFPASLTGEYTIRLTVGSIY